MLQQINELDLKITTISIQNKEELENFRLEYLSKKGSITTLVEAFREVPNEDKKSIGKPLNNLKAKAELLFKTWQQELENVETTTSNDIDLTTTGVKQFVGSHHPLSIVEKEIQAIFAKIGFVAVEGQDIEDDWHNFSALNFAANHPARDMQDTFFMQNEEKENPFVLRTHTTSVQVRVLKNTKPPIRIIAPGRVYRNEAISARAHCFFHQIDGFYVDKNVSFADLKMTLLYFAKELFGADTKIRLRPSYFPFTEPSAEVDVTCNICKAKGCNVCKYTGWLEILGCGMIHPNVIKNCGLDPEEYTGFAFGMGVERIAMLKYQIKDLRLFSQNDTSFLKQF